MLKVAVTGGIGSGKSAVGEILEELGAVIVDADELARTVIERGNSGYDQVLAAFGDEVLTSGEIDRAKLAGLVFSDPELRKKLESIIHPLVREAAEEIMKSAPSGSVVVNEIPLLFETNGAKRFDFVIAVQTPMELRIERLSQRGMKLYEIEKRIAVQASDQERASIANVIVVNDGSLDQLRSKVEELWFTQLQPKAGS
ncbi:MAG: dephospho-CoA kinase [Actinobacteria bacterium]|nr:dephospho-CoA kinase [Actinomycetota bacterium]